MTAILQTFLMPMKLIHAISWENFHIFDYTSTKVCLWNECPIDIKSALVQIMVWCQTGDKPLFETMTAHSIDAYTNDLVQDCSNSIDNALELPVFHY